MTNSNSKNLHKAIGVICLILLCIASFMFAGCAQEEDKEGIKLSSKFQTSYVKGQTIDVYNGKDSSGEETTTKSSTIPNFAGGGFRIDTKMMLANG